ncbi:MAG: catalase family protein [Gammaproteobacteria bacterium]|nr:catalase family protein [Gammaproteobacteria bacterium]MBU1489239.1 catalase family protein [Gammaproteobacteria bacterium]MBU2065328.1 catalase family protein [Gammaproteobacteria bacterium]MBU2139703.1 catalase family protein [Gammaproteobacteria bacterium]MBU2216013.1 catalase family protein [Gammaproteobacteria bacterium]
MLKKLWLWLGRWLAKLTLTLVVVAGLSWGLGTAYYSWKFSGPVSSEEQIPPDEDRYTQTIIEDAIRVVEQHRDNTRVLRDAHAKAHGCLKAEVSVLQDLAPDLRHGVLQEPGKTWQAWVRLSNGNAYPQFDRARDARGMAIKLLDVPGIKLLPSPKHASEQDFVMFNHPAFFVRDVAEYQSNFAAQADGKKVLAFFPSWDPRSWEVRHLIIALKTLSPAPQTPVQTTYNSIAPFKLGPHNIKYRVIPAAENCPNYSLPTPNTDLPNFLRSSLYQQLSLDRSPACFALQVQKQNPQYYMPIEDPSVEWDESISPFQTVALITLPAQDFDSSEQNLFCDNLAFNPWHALPEHRPIGGINRLRKAVYQAVSIYRQERNQAQTQ